MTELEFYRTSFFRQHSVIQAYCYAKTPLTHHYLPEIFSKNKKLGFTPTYNYYKNGILVKNT